MSAPATISKDGDHFTLVASHQVGQMLQTATWKTGAIMVHCDSITIEAGDPIPRFSCPDPSQEPFLASIAKAMTQTGPVNVGLTGDKEDGLRAVFYFPSAKIAKRRMDAAITKAGGPPEA